VRVRFPPRAQKKAYMTKKIKWSKQEKNLLRAVIELDPDNKNGKQTINYLKRMLNPERDKEGIMMKMGRMRMKEYGLDPIYTGETINVEKSED